MLILSQSGAEAMHLHRPAVLVFFDYYPVYYYQLILFIPAFSFVLGREDISCGLSI